MRKKREQVSIELGGSIALISRSFNQIMSEIGALCWAKFMIYNEYIFTLARKMYFLIWLIVIRDIQFFDEDY